jgi:dTMP kinase
MSETTQRKGLFITFEGGEGAGKTTQVGLLQQRLQRMGRALVVTREPGGTALGERLREIILRPSQRNPAPPDTPSQPHMTATAELLLFLAARAELISEVITPAMAAGSIVLCDRYNDSTIAYQGYGRGLDLDAVRTACDLATGGLHPDLSILLDLPVGAGLARKAGGGEWDAIGHESREFHERVRHGFHELAAAEPQRWLIVDAALPMEDVSDTIWQRVHALTG